MPVYNGGHFLEDALDSILNQTYPDFELVISDNASTDNTKDICRRYSRQDSRIRYVRQTSNLGASQNHNLVFEMTQGEYFRWASHDDRCAPTLFEKCMASIERAPQEVVLVYPQSAIISSDGTVESRYHDNLDLRQRSPHERLGHLVRHLRLCNAVYGIIRSDALRRTHLLRPFASSDEVLLAELALIGQFWEVPETLFFRRMHGQTSTAVHPDPLSRTRWFDPLTDKTRVFQRWRVYGEDLRSVATLPLSPGERVRCMAALTRGYIPRYRTKLIRELRRS